MSQHASQLGTVFVATQPRFYFASVDDLASMIYLIGAAQSKQRSIMHPLCAGTGSASWFDMRGQVETGAALKELLESMTQNAWWGEIKYV